MPVGFYSRTELEVFTAPTTNSTVPKCGACGLFKGCKSPKMKVGGKGKKKILVIGEAPGQTEDERGIQFVGKMGKELQKHLAMVGFDLFEDAWTTNSIICRPPNNDTPTDKQIDYCRPNAFNAIRDLNPNVVVLLGNPALTSVLGKLWKQNPGNISRWAGFRAPSQEINAWVCPTFHPSYVKREDSPVLDLIFRQHLKAAFSLTKKPWKTVPDYASRVQCFTDGDEAAKPVRQLLYNRPGRIAFDFETNMTKPDAARARIVCCAISDGKQSLSFVWQGKVIEVMREWLKTDRPKVAANLKFEDRWVKHEFGFQVKGWDFDTMLSSHILDNRPLISGLKFQAFARLGQKEYDKHVAPFLKAKVKGGYQENRIRKCPIKDVLQYCGMDALLEVLLARVHDKELGDELAP